MRIISNNKTDNYSNYIERKKGIVNYNSIISEKPAIFNFNTNNFRINSKGRNIIIYSKTTLIHIALNEKSSSNLKNQEANFSARMRTNLQISN